VSQPKPNIAFSGSGVLAGAFLRFPNHAIATITVALRTC
jgi:hypothetical protein